MTLHQLQRLALGLRLLPGIDLLFRLWYRLGARFFARFARTFPEVRAVYLRRGGGRLELLPGASDLDFFLVLEALPAEREMDFLKKFWRSYFRLRLLFPFFGEVLMGEEAELAAWLGSPSARAFEARYSWQILSGSDFRSPPSNSAPGTREAFTEALRCYCEQLQAVIKLRDSQFSRALAPWQAGAIHWRNSAKAALDLFRLHYAASLPPGGREVEKVWRASRQELLRLLPREKYGTSLIELRPLLLLERELFPATDPFTLFSTLLHVSAACLEEWAEVLGANDRKVPEQGWEIVPEAAPKSSDAYSLSVRELFAERLLDRHRGMLSRAILSEQNTHLFFLFPRLPPLGEFQNLLRDLRDVSFSFDRFSLALPLTEQAFSELERSVLFDSPFHAFARQRECRLSAEGLPQSTPYCARKGFLSQQMLEGTFAELSFVLRYPPVALEYFLERMVGMVLGLRVASEKGEIAASFHTALERYRLRFPDRAAQLEGKLPRHLASEKEAKLVNEIFSRIEEYGLENPAAGASLRSQFQQSLRLHQEQLHSPTLATDLWINLTPFLRMEMAALKEKYFRHRSPLKV